MKFNLFISLLIFFTGEIKFNPNVQQNELQMIDKIQLEEKIFKVSIMYPFAEGNTFDLDYYEKKHMPMVAGYLGSNLIKYTIEKGIASGIPDTPMPFMAIGSFYVKDLQAYSEAIGPKIPEIQSDFPNYTNVQPIILISEVVR